MSFIFENLDAETRGYMLAELDEDLLAGHIYLSSRLSEYGRARYPDLLRDAIASGSATTLEAEIATPGILNAVETRVRKGRPYTASMPSNAAQVMAEGQFNRYYIRGLCGRVLADGDDIVQVYRGRQSWNARTESEMRVGQPISAQALLDDLRVHWNGEPVILPEVNSGLTVRIAD
jgi:hypothetical protein